MPIRIGLKCMTCARGNVQQVWLRKQNKAHGTQRQRAATGTFPPQHPATAFWEVVFHTGQTAGEVLVPSALGVAGTSSALQEELFCPNHAVRTRGGKNTSFADAEHPNKVCCVTAV